MSTTGLPVGPGRETRNPARFSRDESDALVISTRLSTNSLHPADDQRRAAHGLGVVATGTFQPSGLLDDLTSARHLVDVDSTATVRFSNFQTRRWTDKDLRGMATRLQIGDGPHADWEHDLLAISAPRFLSRRVADFHAVVRSSGWQKVMMVFARRLTITGLINLAWMSLKPMRSLAAEQFHGVHTFWLVKDGAYTPFRYRWHPRDSNRSPNGALDSDLASRIGPQANVVEFDLVAQILKPNWPHRILHDAMRRWRKSRFDEVIAGTLTLTTFHGTQHAAEERWSFNPNRMPPGIEPSEDEVLIARSGAYEASHMRRLR